MTNLRSLVALLALAVAPGCSVSHPNPEPDAVPFVFAPSPQPLEPSLTLDAPLADCLGRGGALVEVASVDNNDVQDHGALRTFGVSPGGILAAAGEDGTLKFWTLDAELLGAVDGSVIAYGAQVGAVPITDIAFMGEMAVVGDIRGLVQQMGADGTFGVIGGTSPDVPIVAVAFDQATGRFANAQMGEVVPLAVHSIDGSSPAVEIATTLAVVRDLAFAANGELWVAGWTEGSAAVEVRDAVDPSIVVRTITLTGDAPIAELALSSDGSIAALVASDFLYVVGEDSVAAFPLPEHAASSVALTRDGDFVLSIGADGALIAAASADGREIARATVVRPVTVRVDPSDSLVLVGGQDAIIHAFACQE